MIPITREDALNYHRLNGKPGKLSICPSKPLATQIDLSMAYTPGVAFPVLEIDKDPQMAYEYTSKGNLVAVISNGTAILGLGDRGALAGHPRHHATTRTSSGMWGCGSCGRCRRTSGRTPATTAYTPIASRTIVAPGDRSRQ